MNALAETSTLSDLARAIQNDAIEIIDLTTPLSSATPSLRLPAPFVNLIDFSLEEVSAYNEPGPYWRHNNIHTGEHVGTHIDAPIHWISGRDNHDVSEIPLKKLIGSASVIDLSEEAAHNPDFLLEIAHVQAWEALHGKLAENSWLLFRTGWDQYSSDEAKFLNTDESGSHTPGVSVECAQWLADETKISGFGVETVGIDAGGAGGMDPAFPMHYFLLGKNKYGLTSLQNLAALPPVGSMIIVSPLPIVGGTGSPTRVLALVNRS
ncbi:cyclase family protein [Cryobacterium sp. CG_9.6]|uniref:cyclase family protein n=1 Tax=Cryobacterium sp. CG_9.6 TaxID=2760710 RepID=UPI002473AB4F|nr:cyclase family protein [Cryobacterium sp. CG_9.6]MDH6237122.1 kynurenine formamidase [Cryobacterium sp. CG_9.6]